MEEVTDTKRQVAVMFLGGRLDHATRRVDVEGPLDTPPESYKSVDRRSFPGVKYIPLPTQTYWRYRAISGQHTWWCYILAGYSPSTHELMDANPRLIF